MTHTSLENNIAKLRLRLRQSVEKYDRQESDILLLAVSKTRSAADIRRAYACGLDQFGENYLQEAGEKMAALTDLSITWHFIGPLQSNKTRPIAEQFHWVHSVARQKVARRLSEQRPPGKPPLQVCLQVNISGESSKSGIALEDLPALAAFVDKLPRLQLRGLMAIPAATDCAAEQRAQFARLRNALSALQLQYPQMDTLSMGMSGDMEAAIAEGSTLLRIGTAIFGPRQG
jgi:hypothetical protein